MRFSLAAKWRFLVTAALWAAVAASGQEITRTQIADTLFNADGSRAVGSLRISWKAFTGADGSTVAKNSVDLDIVDGIVSVALAPNLGAVPDGTYYSVEYRLHKGEKSNELWIVPDSEDPVSIADIRVLSVPAAGMAVSLSQVNGLPALLNTKADKAATNTFTAPQVMREDAPGTSNPMLGLQKNDGAAGVYFRLPELSGDVAYTMPPNAGSPNQALTTDGSGALFWSAAAGEGAAYEVLQQAGTIVPQRTAANFTSGFVVSDNADQLRTDITPNWGAAAGTFTQGNDSRLSDARAPLAHASTHAAAGNDPLTPASIGALNRTNDFMVGTSPTTPVLTLQGSTGQEASLQEWRDGSGGLAALITAQGSGFFREIGVAAPTGGTTASQFFEIGGLTKFALSATDGALDVLRYDNAGAFLDRPLRILRSGNIETTVSMKIADAGIGSGSLGLTGNYVELQGVAAPSNPTTGFGRLFLNSANGEVSVRKSSGAVASLEQGGGGGGGDVVGAASSIDNALPRFDGTGGKTLQASGVTVDDSDNISVPGTASFGSGATPYNLTGYTDDVAPSAPGTANQVTEYYDRSSGLPCWIINGGSTQCTITQAQIDTAEEINALTTDDDFATLTGAQTIENKTLSAPTINNPVLSTNSYYTFTEMTAPGNPATNDARLYAKDVGGITKICLKDSAGTETCIGDGGGCAIQSGFQPIVSQIGTGTRNPGSAFSSLASGSTAGNASGAFAGHSTWASNDFAVATLVLPPCYAGEGVHLDITAGLAATATWTTDSSMDIQYRCIATDEGTTAGTTGFTDSGANIMVDMTGYTNNDWVIWGQNFTPSGCAAGEIMQVKLIVTVGTNSFPYVHGLQVSNQ